jgi:hypothetical protein
LISPSTISPARRWALLGAMSKGFVVIMEPVERSELFTDGLIDAQGGLTRAGGVAAAALPQDVMAAHDHWKRRHGVAA